jgi:bifunctional DNase/RNase
MQIEMTIKGLMIDPITNMPIIILRDQEGQRVLPIWVGVFEANAIALQIENVQTPRPMTHDLLKNILEEMAVQVTSVVITELRDQVFHAVIGLQRNGSSYEISSRPSDAIALAVRLGCKIFASEEVLEEASIVIPADGEEEEKQLQEFREFLENVTPEDFQ